MRRRDIALALLWLAAVPALLSEARGQEEPPLVEEKPAPPAQTPAPPPPAPEAPALAPAITEPQAVPMKPLSARLDYTRWQSMTPRERQSFVEGAVSILESIMARLRTEVGPDSRGTPEKMASLVRFIEENEPRRSVSAYLKEMEVIYATAEGQSLSMRDCFLRAFKRLNAR
jgi:hypothetical protein